MKLNLDCMRCILLNLEDLPFRETISPDQLHDVISDYSPDEIDYAILKMYEAGLVNANIENYLDGTIDIEIFDISYNGHQFLANIRENKIWSATKSVMGKVGSTSVTAAAQIATGVVTELIKQTIFPLV